MKILILLFKEKIKNLFKNKKTHFFLMFFSIFLIIVFFAPLFQFQLFNQIKNNDFLNKSGTYHYKVVLPSKNLHNINEEEFIKKEFDRYKGKIQYIYSPSFVFLDFEKKKIYYIKQNTTSKTFNKIIDGSTNEVLYINDLKDDEIILNTKFVNSNNEVIVGKFFELGDKKYKIFFKGERASDFSLNFKDSLKNTIFLDLLKEKGYFKNIANILVNKKQYNYLLKKYKQEDNQTKNIYVKFNNEKITTIDKKNLNNIIKFFNKKWEKTSIKINEFYKDTESGLKIRISKIFDIFIISLFVVLLLIILFLFFKFNKDEINYRKDRILFLIYNGFDYKKIIFIDTIFNFFVLLSTTFLGIITGTFFVDFFYYQNFESSLLFLEKIYFSSIFMVIFLFFIPFFLTFSFFIYEINYYKTKIIYDFKKNNDEIEYIFLFFKKIFLFFTIKLKLSGFIFFKNFSKKIFLFFNLFLIMLIFFVLFFLKISFSNFINLENFFPKEIKSISKINNIDLKNNRKILNKIYFIEKKELEKYKIYSFKDIPEFFISKEKYKDKNFKNKILIKLNINDLNIDEQKIQMFKNFGIKEIYIEFIVFDEEHDYPTLILDNQILIPRTSGLENEQSFLEKNKEIFTLFFDKKWTKFFPDLKKDFKKQGIKIENGNFFLENKPNENYIILPESYKTINYKQGDEIWMKFFVNREILYRNDKFVNSEYGPDEWKFIIAGFISSEKMNQSTSIVNYEFLLKNNIVNENTKINNFILSKKNENFLIKNPVIFFDTNFSNFKEIYKNFVILNQESSLLSSIMKMNLRHFKIYDFYFNSILFIIFVILFLVFINISDSLFKNNEKLFKKFNIQGFSIKKLIFKHSFNYLVLILSTLFLTFFFSLYVFDIFSWEFSKLGINLNIFHVWEYLGYSICIVFFILIIDWIVQFLLFKNKKNKNF